MNGLNFLCFMEENKRRQRGGEKGDLSTGTCSHAHTGQPGACWWPGWHGSLAQLWASSLSGLASPGDTSHSVTALIPPPGSIIFNSSPYNDSC